MSKSLLAKINSVGLSYQQYANLTKQEVEETSQVSLTDEERKQYEDKKLNLHRMKRIEKHYVVPDEIKTVIQQIIDIQTWMIISETWCGDSAQNIPYIAKITELNPQIILKIILRDANLEIMDLYLTNGTRSIPILVAFDEDGKELFRWGPRPQKAKNLFSNLKARKIEKSAILEKLHLWYGRNGGSNLEAELMEVIRHTLLSDG